MGRHVKDKKTTKTKAQQKKRLRDLLDELHSQEQHDSAKRAEDILRLIRSRQGEKLPRLEDTIDPHQFKRLKPLAWLIDNQSYTTEEIQLVCLINEQRLNRLRENDAEALKQSGALDGLQGLRYNELRNQYNKKGE